MTAAAYASSSVAAETIPSVTPFLPMRMTSHREISGFLAGNGRSYATQYGRKIGAGRIRVEAVDHLLIFPSDARLAIFITLDFDAQARAPCGIDLAPKSTPSLLNICHQRGVALWLA